MEGMECGVEAEAEAEAEEGEEEVVDEHADHWVARNCQKLCHFISGIGIFFRSLINSFISELN
jgi:hypothetical protein